MKEEISYDSCTEAKVLILRNRFLRINHLTSDIDPDMIVSDWIAFQEPFYLEECFFRCLFREFQCERISAYLADVLLLDPVKGECGCLSICGSFRIF